MEPINNADIGSVDLIPSSSNLLESNKKILDQTYTNINFAPVISSLHTILSQSKKIELTIPANIKRMSKVDLPEFSKIPQGMINEIDIQLGNILKIQIQCLEPMKKSWGPLTFLNKDELKKIIRICRSVSPVLKRYEYVLLEIKSGKMKYLTDFYILSSSIQVALYDFNKMNSNLRQGGKKRRKKTKRKKLKKRKKTKRKKL